VVALVSGVLLRKAVAENCVSLHISVALDGNPESVAIFPLMAISVNTDKIEIMNKYCRSATPKH
jgi:hypothetical protein